ncbi:MAG: DNA polymerase III subunit alpha, partial [Acidocella sp.]|nr:DNA polymerase III subunit alpha [Acidocella sp.]
SGQVALFSQLPSQQALALPAAQPWGALDQIAFAAEAIGFHLTAHPLDAYRNSLRKLGVVSSSQIESIGTGRIKLAGSVVSTKERTTQKGTRIAFELTLFHEALSRARPLLGAGTMLIATVEVRVEAENRRLIVQDLVLIDQAAAGLAGGLDIWLESEMALPRLHAVLAENAAPRGGRVRLIPQIDQARAVRLGLPGHYSITPRMLQIIAGIPGISRVEDG